MFATSSDGVPSVASTAPEPPMSLTRSPLTSSKSRLVGASMVQCAIALVLPVGPVVTPNDISHHRVVKTYRERNSSRPLSPMGQKAISRAYRLSCAHPRPDQPQRCEVVAVITATSLHRCGRHLRTAGSWSTARIMWRMRLVEPSATAAGAHADTLAHGGHHRRHAAAIALHGACATARSCGAPGPRTSRDMRHGPFGKHATAIARHEGRTTARSE